DLCRVAAPRSQRANQTSPAAILAGSGCHAGRCDRCPVFDSSGGFKPRKSCCNFYSRVLHRFDHFWTVKETRQKPGALAKKKTQWVQVGKRRLELSNLDKVLFPEDGVLKAE